MLVHYFRQALRVMRKQRLYAAINVLGLSVALAVTTLIVLFVQDEFSYDNWHEEIDRIVRVDDVDFNPDGSIESQQAQHPYPFAAALEREHPDVEATVQFNDAEVVIRDGQAMHRADVLFAGERFFDVFTYEPIHGSLASALSDPASVVVTRSGAVRLFGDLDVVGRSVDILFDGTYETGTVTAVVEDAPSGTHLPFEVMMPFHRLPLVYSWVASRVDNWRSSSFPTYALLRNGSDLETARTTVKRLWKTFNPDRTQQAREAGWWTGEGDPAGLDMVPLRDLHLRADVVGAFVPTSSPAYSYILLGIAGLILALACINFTLLAIGQGATRASEIGVRKTLGARRGEIVAQFGGEALLLSLLGLGGGLLLAQTLLPAASTLSGKQLELSLTGSPALAAWLVAITLATGIAAGIYPSLVVSRHRPSETLRGRFRLSGSGGLTRMLLVTQFAGSVVLMAGALAMKAQLEYMQTRDLGYEGENVVVVDTRGRDGLEAVAHMKDALRSHTAVTAVSGISLSLNRGYSRTGWMVGDQERRAFEYNVDMDLPELLRMDLVAGRAPQMGRAADSAGVLINEAFAADWGWTPKEAIGNRILEFEDEPEILGVLQDANFRSQHEAVFPTMFLLNGQWLQHVLVRAAPGRTPDALAAIEGAWNSFAPDIPLGYTFLDEDVARAYETDRQWARIVQAASAVAILVACLGLFGLAALTVSRRTKEIGIRKVLGASAGSVTLLVSREFALIVATATVIATPLAWVGLSRWLEGFAYRISLNPLIFLLAGGIVLAIALATVAYHSVRAAISDPVKSLRYE